jgi:hypothetical protein
MHNIVCNPGYFLSSLTGRLGRGMDGMIILYEGAFVTIFILFEQY